MSELKEFLQPFVILVLVCTAIVDFLVYKIFHKEHKVYAILFVVLLSITGILFAIGVR
jgi:hypothetical protein